MKSSSWMFPALSTMAVIVIIASLRYAEQTDINSRNYDLNGIQITDSIFESKIVKIKKLNEQNILNIIEVSDKNSFNNLENEYFEAEFNSCNKPCIPNVENSKNEMDIIWIANDKIIEISKYSQDLEVIKPKEEVTALIKVKNQNFNEINIQVGDQIQLEKAV